MSEPAGLGAESNLKVLIGAAAIHEMASFTQKVWHWMTLEKLKDSVPGHIKKLNFCTNKKANEQTATITTKMLNNWKNKFKRLDIYNKLSYEIKD